MRSSGRTTVSRTRARMASVRRRRRGRRLSGAAAAAAARSTPLIVFVDIVFVSLEKEVAGAVGRAEAATGRAVGAVRAEQLRADRAALQPHHFFRLPAADADPRNIARRHVLSIIRGLS